MKLSFTEYQRLIGIARNRAERITEYRRVDMRQAMSAAGFGASCGLNVLHNALLSAESGRPWPEVNYAAARRARWIESRLFDAHRIYDAYERRLFDLTR